MAWDAEHNCHSYAGLIRRWRSLLRPGRLVMEPFAEADGELVYTIASRVACAPGQAVYLSAGIHGDEPGATEGLLLWAQSHLERLARGGIRIFPCLNPGGLILNTRLDGKGRDLNRLFAAARPPAPIAALKRLIAGEKYALSIQLHEDYDARGVYVYEIAGKQASIGRELLEAARPWIGPEDRKTVDGRRARQGLLLRKVKASAFPLMPEALYLHFHHSRRCFTFETPSEFSLELRARAHVALVSKAMELSGVS